MRTSLICSLSTALLIGAGCKSSHEAGRFTSMTAAEPAPSLSVTNQLDPELLRPAKGFFKLGPGDRLEIEILGQPETRADAIVGPDGKIYYHLLSGIDVWGKTLGETREALEKGLSNYMNQPQVALTLREVGSKYVWLLGRLTRPGIYPMPAPMTLLESLALAGGSARSASQVTTAELGDLRHSFVMRQGQLLPVDFRRLLQEGDASQNVYLQPDDFVYVPSALAQEVYVLGAVRAPRAVPYVERMTVIGALAGASGAVKIDWFSTTQSGIAFDAYLSHVAVVRGSLTQPQLTVVNCNDIIKGRAPDFPLEPGDIVFVPNAPYSTLKRYLNTVINTFIMTLAANEGIRAGGGQVGVGVSVPVGGR